MKPALRPDIARALVDHAEAARRHHAKLTRGRLDRSDLDRVRRGDFANARVLRRLVAEHGWPDRTLVGDAGADAAWLIALYADVEPELQCRALRLIASAVERGEALIQQWAHFYDRCSVNAGKRQLYGTQYQHGPAPHRSGRARLRASPPVDRGCGVMTRTSTDRGRRAA